MGTLILTMMDNAFEIWGKRRRFESGVVGCRNTGQRLLSSGGGRLGDGGAQGEERQGRSPYEGSEGKST